MAESTTSPAPTPSRILAVLACDLKSAWSFCVSAPECSVARNASAVDLLCCPKANPAPTAATATPPATHVQMRGLLAGPGVIGGVGSDEATASFGRSCWPVITGVVPETVFGAESAVTGAGLTSVGSAFTSAVLALAPVGGAPAVPPSGADVAGAAGKGAGAFRVCACRCAALTLSSLSRTPSTAACSGYAARNRPYVAEASSRRPSCA